MSRMKLSEERDYEIVGGNTLDELIPNYYANKQELDSYKKICDTENAKIKDFMLEAGESEHRVGDLVAKRIVTRKETMDEAKLLATLHKHGIESAIKTREYVDMDTLESYLYNNEPTNDLASDLANCKDVKEVVQLRVSKKKRKGDDD